MDPEQSFLLKALTDEYNRRVVAEGKASFSNVMHDCIVNAKEIFPAHYQWATSRTVSRSLFRIRHDIKVQRHLLKRFAPAFREFELALAAAEFSNRYLVHAFFERDKQARGHILFDMKEIVGGITAKLLMLSGLHARLIRAASEVQLLLHSGFVEGASARSRTLYELVIKALVILHDPSDSGCELAERYYVSGLKEEFGNGPYSDKEIQQVMDEARKRWGREYFVGDNNWALPAVKPAKGNRVTFKDLEEFVEAQDIHHMYAAGNDAIHAGASRATGEADFRRRYLFNSRSEVEVHSTAVLGHYACFYLTVGVYEIARSVTSDARQWDYFLSIGDFMVHIKKASDLFAELIGP